MRCRPPWASALLRPPELEPLTAAVGTALPVQLGAGGDATTTAWELRERVHSAQGKYVGVAADCTQILAVGPVRIGRVFVRGQYRDLARGVRISAFLGVGVGKQPQQAHPRTSIR